MVCNKRGWSIGGGNTKTPGHAAPTLLFTFGAQRGAPHHTTPHPGEQASRRAGEQASEERCRWRQIAQLQPQTAVRATRHAPRVSTTSAPRQHHVSTTSAPRHALRTSRATRPGSSLRPSTWFYATIYSRAMCAVGGRMFTSGGCTCDQRCRASCVKNSPLAYSSWPASTRIHAHISASGITRGGECHTRSRRAAPLQAVGRQFPDFRT